MTRTRLAIALGTLISLLATWAVPIFGTAHFSSQRDRTPTQKTPAARPLAPISFREVKNRGLLVNAWINGSGPYVLAIDTGAGLSMIGQNIADRLNLPLRAFKGDISGGLSATPIHANQETTINQLALGTSTNLSPGPVQAIVATNLPAGLDGVLDPTEALRPLGYSVDLPSRTLETFDTHRLSISDKPPGGAVVRWVRERGDHRPYVRLGDGRLALIDTGSGFGLAVTDSGSRGMNHGRTNGTVRDLGGGTVSSQRIAPVTVNIGDLVLRSVPTDLLTGVAPDTPVILGRDALYPFKIIFDPTVQLIAIEPSTRR